MALIDPKSAGDYGTLIGSLVGLLVAIGTVMSWPFRMFQTKSAAKAQQEVNDKTYVRKVEDDGTRIWVHAKEWEEMKTRMDNSIEESAKWRMLAENWMKHP